MRLKIILFGFCFSLTNFIFAQVPHNVNVPSNGTAERVARFKVQDEARDFLEITNSTNHAGKFIPSIWAHQESDNRYVLRHFASTKSSYDTGTLPLMMFRAELRNGINLNAPSGGTFPWGTSASNVVNRPVFGWENGNSRLMTLRANGNLGVGTSTPSARLHTNGTLRFQNLPNGNSPTYMLGTDASGNVKEYPVSGGGSSDSDWLKTTGGTPTSVNDNIYTNGRVGIGTTNPQETLHLNGSIRGNVGTGALRVKSSTGYLDLGSQNTSWAHIYTDRPRVIFNKPVYAIGGNFSAYSNSNLYLQTNGTTRITALSSNGNVGIGTTAPTAKFHNVGTVRLQDLPNGKKPNYILGTDLNGYVREYSSSVVGGGISLQCLLPSPETATNRLTKVLPSGNLTCSQVFDNGTNVGIGTTSPIHKLSVNGNVHSMSNIFISDKKFKKNITEIKSPLATVLKLNGKKYDWKVGEFEQYDFTNRKQIGFIAQEVKEIIPEIVYVDKNNEHSMNYTAIIPLLVEAIKEQQNQITLLQNKLTDVKKAPSVNEKETLFDAKTSFSTNYPNPFSSTTTVDYFIMKKVKAAKIIIYDSNGSTINTHKLDDRGKKSQLVIRKNGLETGIYFYTLIADDIVIGTKKMIVK